jgi:hypothetical protein
MAEDDDDEEEGTGGCAAPESTSDVTIICDTVSARMDSTGLTEKNCKQKTN